MTDGAEKLTLKLQTTLKACRCLIPRGVGKNNNKKKEAKSEKGRTFREKGLCFASR